MKPWLRGAISNATMEEARQRAEQTKDPLLEIFAHASEAFVNFVLLLNALTPASNVPKLAEDM